METLEAIRTRRSIRRFTSEPIPAEIVTRLLAAAMSAPSAGNQQPWHFVVVDDRKLLDAVPGIHPYAGMCKTASVGVLVCGDTNIEKFPGFWVQDCSAATQNMLLAAHDLKLGAVWAGIYPLEDRVRAFRSLFGLPAHVIPLCLVVLGYPDQRLQAEDRFLEERIHRNTW